MILSKLPCPDCGGGGRDAARGGLCRACHGEGKRRPTAAEEAAHVERSLTKCPCGAVAGGCNGSCGMYIFGAIRLWT